MTSMFSLSNLWKIYQMDGVETIALQNINLEIKKGEYSALIGPSGSGKSTLMHIMGCLDTPTKGKIVLDGEDISTLKSDELALVRREKLGFIFQAYNLIQGLTALENVALPLRLSGNSKESSEDKAHELLKKVNLENRIGHKSSELSGGEQQRVAICRALVNEPEAILADEPTGNLDSKSGAEIFNLLENLHRKEKKTILVVTHDVNLAKRIDRKIHIKDGQIVKKE